MRGTKSRYLLVGAIVAACFSMIPVSPVQADNCTGNARPCSPKCVRLGNLYDQRNRAVERVNRRLVRNSRKLDAALNRNPVDQAEVDRLERRDAYLRKLYDRRHRRLMRTYRRYLATCF